MKATIKELADNGKNYGHKKELIQTFNVVTATSKGLKEIITVRCYMGRSANASVVYASIWVTAPDYHGSGTGKAGGYGYHKPSAAIGDAIASAGIGLSKDISGVGNGAIAEALGAIAEAMGYNKFLIVEN